MHVAICAGVYLGDNDVTAGEPVTHLVVVGRGIPNTVSRNVLEIPVDNESDAPIYIYFAKARAFIEHALARNGTVLVLAPEDSRRATVREC